MEMISLSASARPADLKAKALRRTGKVPGVLYGNVKGTTQLCCEEKALLKAYNQAGESTLVELDFDGKKVPVLFHDLDQDPVTDRLSHVDFYAVDMNKEIDASVPLRMEGLAPAVKEHGAILVTPVEHLKIRCLPADLPQYLLVNVDSLKAFHDTVTVAAIALPKGVTVLDTPDTVVVLAQEPRKEEEVVVAAPVAGADGTTPVAGAEGATAEAGKEPAGDAAKAGDKKEEKKK